MKDKRAVAGCRMAGLFADAEFAEDEIKDVVAGGGTGESVEGVEGVVEIEKEHLVGNGASRSLPGLGESGQCGCDGLLLAEVGEESCLGRGRRGRDVREDCRAEFVNA